MKHERARTIAYWITTIQGPWKLLGAIAIVVPVAASWALRPASRQPGSPAEDVDAATLHEAVFV